MEADMLEAKFQKAESDLNHLTRKLELRCQDQAEGDSKKNPLELLRKVSAVKEQYKSLVKESAEIQKAQAEAMDYFKSQLPIALQALQQLQIRVGMEGTEEDQAKVAELESMLGLELSLQPSQSDSSPAITASSVNHQLNTERHSEEAAAAVEPESRTQCPPVLQPIEDPIAERSALRASSEECVDVSEEEFMSVSELIRGRVKLAEVNTVYRRLFSHFKETKKSEALSASDMHKMGLKVSGATGQAKLKVLRALKLLTISSKGEVKMERL